MPKIAIIKIGWAEFALPATSVKSPIAAVRRAAAKFFCLCPICNVQGPADLIVDELVDAGSFQGHPPSGQS